MNQTIEFQCKQAKNAAPVMNTVTSSEKNKSLQLMAQALRDHTPKIISENQKDIDNGIQNNLSKHLIDRLTLTKERLLDMACAIEMIVTLPDPIDTVLNEWKQKDGLTIKKVCTPIGVIGMIYEARPNVTADAISLAIKTNNCVVLRGSSSAYNSNKVISDILKEAAATSGIPKDAIQLLEDTSRESVTEFVKMNNYLDLIIPRGGAELIQRVCNTATVPTIETGAGNCHVYIDKDADLTKALDITLNAKLHRPSVCNSTESLLVHQEVANQCLPDLLNLLLENNVEIRGCPITQKLNATVTPAEETDWSTEYLGPILSVKVVPSLEEAIQHINTYGSMHTEAIISENSETISAFQKNVDASTIISNASTRFTDGGVFGFGAEIGISTQKIHARGPMGLPEITTYKYLVIGEGQIRK